MITIPSLNNVTDILDTDMIMVTQQSGQSYKIAGSELNKRGKIIIANSTTITGAPLKAGSSVRVYFTVDLTAANASTTLQLNYNNVNYYVKAPKDGTLINFVATNLGGSPAVYKYLQKYTTLELLFDGTQFVIIGNPVILSSADYTIYADGLQRVNAVISGNKNMVTSDAVARNLSPLGKQVLIYNGETYDGTEKSLTQSLKNFRYLYIGLKTNIEYDYMFLPTENIRNGDVFARTMMFSNTLGQTTLPFSYQSSAKITIVSPTSFYVQSVYNNINWILKVYAIWGIN